MDAPIRLLDAVLRRAYGIYEFTEDPNCLFRLSAGRLQHSVALPDGALPAGTPVAVLHFWNDHFPKIPPEGPDLGWAIRLQRQIVSSLRQVGTQIGSDPRLVGVRAVGGITVLFTMAGSTSADQLLARLGFTVFPYRDPLGRFGTFWQNLYTWWLMSTFNRGSVRHKHLLQIERTEVWMSSERYLGLYGPREVPAQRTAA